MKLDLKKISLQKTKLFLAGVGIVSFVGVIIVLMLALGHKEPPKPPPLPENPQGADIIIDNFHYTSTNEQGVKEWELKADTASYFQGNRMASFEGVEVTFYAKDGRTFNVKGNQGVLDTEARDFELSGNVVGTSSDGNRFRTESITYTAAKNQARTDKKVFLDNPQFKLEGTGMILDLKEQKLSLLKNVRAQSSKK